MTLTVEKLTQLFPRTKNINEWFSVLDAAFADYEINTNERIAAFLAQTSHESADFNTLSENLNYSSDGLHKVFPKYFPTLESAEPYNRHPEDIANKIYGGRMGNTEDGDGWKFHGRGLIQVTGKSNYAECSQFLFQDDRLLGTPDYLITKEGAVKSACWFWTARKLNDYADGGDLETMTKRINGGTIGLSDRIERYNRMLPVIQS